MKKRPTPIFFRFSLMMLLQYMICAVWWVPFAAYLANIHVSGAQNALMLSSFAIGMMASPLIGMVADRYFPSEKVLVILNLINAVLLLLAGLVSDHNLLLILMLADMLFFMPTWSLANSITMSHIPSEKFPNIRVFGSIGWFASGIFSLIMVKFFDTGFDGTRIPFFFSSGLGLLACLFSLTLPSTPPPSRDKMRSVIDVLGLRSAGLMKDWNFATFIILSFLSVIPFSMYFSYCSEFLLGEGFKFITITMNWGQLGEMLFMLSLPLAIKKIGIKYTMALGLFLMTVRYIAFYLGAWMDLSGLFYLGILVHGFVFGYFYVGGQIYVDKKAPAELRAQSQGFISLVTFGAGLIIGNFISRQIIDHYSAVENNIMTIDWTMIWAISGLMSLILLLVFLVFLKNEDKKSGVIQPET